VSGWAGCVVGECILHPGHRSFPGASSLQHKCELNNETVRSKRRLRKTWKTAAMASDTAMAPTGSIPASEPGKRNRAGGTRTAGNLWEQAR
jgi:hypothetical protein